MKAVKEKGIDLKIRYVMEQSTVFDLVAQGLGVSVTLDPTMRILRENPNINARPLEESVLFQTGTFWRKDKYLSESARKLITFLDEVIC